MQLVATIASSYTARCRSASNAKTSHTFFSIKGKNKATMLSSSWMIL